MMSMSVPVIEAILYGIIGIVIVSGIFWTARKMFWSAVREFWKIGFEEHKKSV